MKRRDPHQWSKDRKNDFFFMKAKKEGYKARSAYKLIEINSKFNLFKKNNLVLDLGSAPGAWSQVVLKNGALVDSIDLLKMDVPKANFLQADIFSQQTKDFIANKKYDLILSDMAPNCTGAQKHNHINIMHLVNQVFEFMLEHLKKDGNICIKIFDGAEFNEFFHKFKVHFATVKRNKPAASLADTSEFYLIGMGFKKDLD